MCGQNTGAVVRILANETIVRFCVGHSISTGFDWGASIRVEFAQTVEIPPFPTRFVKCLVESGSPARRGTSHDSIVTRQATGRIGKQRERSRNLGLPDDDDTIPDNWDFSDSPDYAPKV